MNPRVVSAEALPGHRLRLVFTSGEQKLFDCATCLDFGVFQKLRSPDYFQRVRVENGTVTWPHGQDVCPDTLYLDARPDEGARPSV